MSTAAEYVAAEDFERARRILDEAYAADPRPELLYSRAQVERIAGNCNEARRLFDLFASAASEEDAADARRLSERCTPADPPEVGAPLEEPEPSVPPASTVREPTATPAANTPEPRRVELEKPWSRRPLPAVMMGVGLGALGAGTGLVAYASIHDPIPADARNEGHYGELTTRQRGLTVAGVAVITAGAALAIGAGVIWAVLARRQRGTSVEAAWPGMSIRF